MKRLLTAIIMIFAIIGMVISVFSIYLMVTAGSSRSANAQSIGIMYSVSTAARLYSAENSNDVGLVNSPQGDGDTFAQTLIREGFFNDAGIMNETGELVDAWGTPLYFVLSGKDLCIFSAGKDMTLRSSDDLVLLSDLSINLFKSRSKDTNDSKR